MHVIAVGGLVLSLLWTSYSSVVAATEPGFISVDPFSGSNFDVCSEPELTFICTTTGPGETRLMFRKNELLVRYRHSCHRMPNQCRNTSLLDGEVRVGNLSRSESPLCFDEQHNTTECFNTSLVVQVTNRTVCDVVTCSTLFNDGSDIIEVFGNVTIAMAPPQPSNLQVRNLSSSNLTISWDPGTVTDCPIVLQYEVLVSGCGDYCRNITTSKNSITCEDVAPGQQCTVTVRSMLECGFYSSSSTLKFLVPKATTTILEATATTEATATSDNTGTTIGIAVGVCVPVLLLLLFIGGLILFIMRKSLRCGHNPEQTLTSEHVDVSEAEENAETSFSNTNDTTLNMTVGSEDTAANNNERPLPSTNSSNYVAHPSEENDAEESVKEKPNPTADAVSCSTKLTPHQIEDLNGCYLRLAEEQPVQSASTETAASTPLSVTQDAEESMKEKPNPTAVVSGITKSTKHQIEDLNRPSLRDATMSFNAIAGGSSENSVGVVTTATSLVTLDDGSRPDTKIEHPKSKHNLCDGGMLLSQEVTHYDSEDPIDNGNGQSQAVARGAQQQFGNVVGTSSNDNPDLRQIVADVQAKQCETDRKVEELTQSFARDKKELTEKLAMLTDKYTALEEKIKLLEQRKTELEQNNTDLKQTNVALQQENTALRQMKSADKQRYEHDGEELRKRLQESEKENDELRNKLVESEEEKDKFKDENDRLRNELEKCYQERKELLDGMEKIKKELKSKEEEGGTQSSSNEA